MEALHSAERVTTPALDQHIQFLHSLNIFGISDHNLLFTKSSADVDVTSPAKSAAMFARRMITAETPRVWIGEEDEGDCERTVGLYLCVFGIHCSVLIFIHFFLEARLG